MTVDEMRLREIVNEIAANEDEKGLVNSFANICLFLAEFPSELSWRASKAAVKPDIGTSSGLEALASRFFEGYRRSDFPADPSTVPDEMVSVVMEEAYGYGPKKCGEMKVEHQHSMCAENCVGNLLERYLDSKLRASRWSWCCGDFVKAIDFLGKDDSGQWVALQIKNRDNTENSSSSAIRDGKRIQKWHRSFSKDTKKGRSSFTNWANLPPLMQGFGLGEEDFQVFVREYLRRVAGI